MGKASTQRQPIRNVRKRQSTFLVACWEEKNYSRLQQVEHLWEKKQWKTPREDPWHPSNMAWQDVNTRIDAFCWRPLGVEDSDRKRKSARNVMIKCLSILIAYLNLSFHCCVIFLTISCWILDESRSSQSSLFLNRNKKNLKKPCSSHETYMVFVASLIYLDHLALDWRCWHYYVAVFTSKITSLNGGRPHELRSPGSTVYQQTSRLRRVFSNAATNCKLNTWPRLTDRLSLKWYH